MAIEPGGMLSRYRLVEKIGEGGMGVVWKAVDTTLDREVAVKVLSSDFSGDRERLARFGREAKLLASLNQRNIASIYGFEESGGVPFLVMELVEGEDLGERLRRGPLPIDKALDVGDQIARALEAAHEKGVVHRDLKPGNVKLTREGRVKVLDFGLAKALESPSTAGDPSRSPTVTSAGTRTGVILGTASYMSPEQARGRPVDKRTDIWSFGCVLYECLTGRQVFEGETVSDALASILKTEPDWSILPGATPPRVRELLRRCLQKDVRNRLRDIGDARIELESGPSADVAVSGELAPAPSAARLSPSRLGAPMFVLAAVLVGAVLGIAAWVGLTGSGIGDEARGVGVVRLDLRVPEEWIPGAPIVSPDGRTVVYRAWWKTPGDDTGQEARLFVRGLADARARPVRGSENAGGHGFSPDGRWLLFHTPSSGTSAQAKLYKVPVDGSAPPVQIAVMPERWTDRPIWLSADEIVLLAGSPQSVVRIPADGSAPGPPVEVETVGFEGRIFLEARLPHGRHVLATSPVWSERGWSQRVPVLDVETGQARMLIEDAHNPRWSSTGHLLFSRHDTLLAVPLDPERHEITGGPVAITDGLRTETVWGGGPFDVSSNGTLVHFAGGILGADRRLQIVAPDGSVEPWSDDRRPFINDLDVSMDGRRLSVIIPNPSGLFEIWGSEIDRPILRRFAAEPGHDCSSGVLSADGTRLAYRAIGFTEDDGIWIREIDKPDPPRLVSRVDFRTQSAKPRDFTPDGTHVLVELASGGKPDLALIEIAGPGGDPGEPRVLIENAWVGELSPDGRWIAYLSDASGRSELYIRPFSSNGTVGRAIPVTTRGADGGGWFKQQRPLKLLYMKDMKAYAVVLQTAPSARLSEPEHLAWADDLFPKTVTGTLLRDGRAMVIFKGEGEHDPQEIRVVLDWFDELQRTLAAGL